MAAACDGMSRDAVGIIESAPYFAVRYRHPGFGKEYLFNGDSRFFEKERGEALMRKLRLITARNRITHELLNAVFMRQRDYFHSGNPLDLKPLSRAELALTIKAGNGADPVIDASRISRLISGKTVVVPSGRERPLKFFFPAGREIHRRAISALMDEERKELSAGKLKRPLNDGEIRDRLKERHGLAITRRQVGFCRKELGIPNLYWRGKDGVYSAERRRFSAACRLDIASVKKNAPAKPGIYELSLADVQIEYPGGADSVFYIGSAGNIGKRLKEHLKPYNKNGGIREYLGKYDCFFKYIVLETNWQNEEKKLYDLFAVDFCAPPRCNMASPRGRREGTVMKILIIEDNPDHAELASLALDPHFEVCLLESGEDALRYLEGMARDAWPAAILLDHSLPEMDGLTVLDRIIKRGYDVPVIMVTGQGNESIAVEAMKKGAYDYVVKSGDYRAALPSVVYKAVKQHELATEKARLALDLERLVITDDLTGLFNRRYFYRKLDEEAVRAKRQNGKLSLILFDLDHFKEYNDTFGHIEGDRALKEVGRIILSSIRDKVDSGCRYGGDEFAVILPGADMEHASAVAGRIQRSVREKKMGNVGISAGIAEYNPESGMEDFIKTADDALYEAKKLKGRGVNIK